MTIPIVDVAGPLGLTDADLIPYGRGIAKVDLRALEARRGTPDGKLVLVCSITPTPPGDGKTTVSIGLGQALSRIGRRAIVALRQPSIGPCLGVKGGGTGGGQAQLVPADGH
jgi:formate--tetrahydrofolate ligase